MTKEGFRMILFIASLFGWILGSIDISNAFLQQSEAFLKPDLFLQPPKEAGLGPEWVWKALKAPYGTTDAPKNWFLTLVMWFLEQGMIQLRTDLAIFVIFYNGSLAGVIGIHVDDFMFCGNKWFYSHFLPKLRRAFLVGKEKYGDF